MNVFHKVVLRGLRQNRSRTFITVVGVILAAGLITAVATFAVTLQTYMRKGATERYGDWHIEYTDTTRLFIQEQGREEGVERIVAFDNIGYAPLEGGVNEDKPYLFIAGFNEEAAKALPIHLLSGRLPENEKELILPAHVASNGGVKFSIGDTVTLEVGQRTSGEATLNQHDPFRAGELLTTETEKTYTITGFYQRPAFEARTAPGYTAITWAVEEESAGRVTAFITLRNPYQLRSYMETVQDENSLLNDNVLRFMGLSEDRTFNSLLYGAALVVVLLIMIGAVFLIYNAFHISLNERMHQFGILMSVGATARQLRASVLFEGLCIGLVGIPVGMALALPGVRLILSFVEDRFSNILYQNVSMEIVISPAILAVAAGVSMITILISAYIPAKKAARIPVMECIRQTGAIKVEAGDIKTSRRAEAFYGIEGVLALKNFKRNKRRYRSIILSLTLSVILFVSAGAFGTYLEQEVEQGVITVDYDISFSVRDMEEEEFLMLYHNLKEVDGVYDSTYHIAQEEKETKEMRFRSATPGQSTRQMKEILEGAGVTAEYTLENYYELFEQNRNLSFIVNLFTNVFAGMMALIAAANVVNTISTNIKLRRRELAMIRSVGMGERNFNKMMGLECVFYGLRTLLLALPIAGVLSYFIYRVTGEGISFTLPWGHIGISLAGVFLIIFLTTLYTVRRIKRENIIDALRDDMA